MSGCDVLFGDFVTVNFELFALSDLHLPRVRR